MQDEEDKARIAYEKVNALTREPEMAGGPMEPILQGILTHYNQSAFVVVYWKSYVTEVWQAWTNDDGTSRQSGFFEKMSMVKIWSLMVDD